MKSTLNKIKNWTIVKFFTRYWVLLTCLILFLLLALNNTLFSIFGTFIYVPCLTLAAMASALFLRNIFNVKTTDRYSDDGGFDKGWEKLDDKTKVILSTVQICFYFLGASIIAAALISR